ncbi:DUF418 domain-containing protein [Halalkalibacter sp. APA_J-10(15)]|uniref:DUF418 domain-containing protein n=1 Tax=Halalkalibacter sp. APA_J-10(15) TaxID=2933805 RepID=UPI001FF3EB91|nr:DUF418 domain-containing protein [Halalkalibacter sp. APA_J-10(15)]MCK0470366.1 DUF418 domain-containing protein [Halalkalibacter sp. APA_J-10(15)]
MDKTTTSPLLTNDRIESLDMIRGLALLGILLANSMHFQYGLFLIPDIHNYYPNGIIDRITEGFILLFIQASFYTLFSFLFGYGMAFLKERLLTRGQPFARVYWRRMLILLLIGYFHGVYIWDGDILFIYALTGFILFFFLKLKVRGLLIWSIILLSIMALSITVPGEDETMIIINEQLYHYSLEEREVLSSASYSDVVTFRQEADPLGFGWMSDILIQGSAIFSVLGMFLLGAFVARKKWLEQPENYQRLFKRVWWITLCVGFPSKLAYVLNENTQTEALHTFVGGPMVAMFYASSIALLATNKKAYTWLKPLTFVGRLSLTNYLMQSIVFTTLFYGYGIGIFGRVGFFIGVLISLGFFFIQILLSKWWLKRFKIGPIEWLWRLGTYWRRPRFKKEIHS